MSSGFFFSDFMIESNAWSCHWCGEYIADDESREVAVDDGERVRLCLACIEGAELEGQHDAR